MAEGDTQNQLTVSQTETCDTCKLEIDVEDIPTHVVQCLKEAKRCKVCQESLHKSRVKEHLQHWRKGIRIKHFIEEDDEENLKLCYGHGAKPDAVLDKSTNEAALHFVAKFGSL